MMKDVKYKLVYNYTHFNNNVPHQSKSWFIINFLDNFYFNFELRDPNINNNL